MGKLQADGRPILGLSSRDLLEIALETSNQAYLIPAHIWTPWFSTLGSKSGYNSIEACFRDLSAHIFALETGLSSDPAMNRRLSQLDRYTMISNSDAHSPKKIGREATIFDTDLTYDSLFEALKTRQGFVGTLEFFPQEGKYYMDGHRKCGICLTPATTQAYKGICPICGQPSTLGVLHRVEELADRHQQTQEATHAEYIMPLSEVVAELEGSSPNSKGVQQQFWKIIEQFGNELTFLRKTPLEKIQKHLGPEYTEAIRRLRTQQVIRTPGYDGVYGKILIFRPDERKQRNSKPVFFASAQPGP